MTSYTERIVYTIPSTVSRGNAGSGFYALAVRQFDSFEVRTVGHGIEIDGRVYGYDQIDALRDLLDNLHPRVEEVKEDANIELPGFVVDEIVDFLTPKPEVPVEANGLYAEEIVYEDAQLSITDGDHEADIVFDGYDAATDFLEKALAAARAGL